MKKIKQKLRFNFFLPNFVKILFFLNSKFKNFVLGLGSYAASAGKYIKKKGGSKKSDKKDKEDYWKDKKRSGSVDGGKPAVESSGSVEII